MHALRILPPAILALAAGTGALAQTALVTTTHTVVAQGQPPAVEHNFTVTNAGSYSVTLTDLGSKLPTPAPLSSVAMAVTQGTSIVGIPVTSAGTPITFNATASTTYTIHVVGVPGSTLGSGPIEEDVSDSSGNEVFSSIDTLSVPSQQPSAVGIVASTLTVQTGGSYTVALTDLQFPTALQAAALLLIDNTTGTSVALENPPSISFTDTVTLAAGDAYQIVAYGVEASGQVGGLFGISLTPASGAAMYSDLVPVGAVTLLQTSASGTAQSSFTLGSSGATVELTDLSFPSVPLSSVGAAVVDATAQTLAAPAVTGTGAQSISAPSASDSYEVYAYAVPNATASSGSYSVVVQQGTAYPFSEAQAVSSSSTIQAFSLDSSIPSAGSYVLTLTDFQFPAQLTSDALAAVQNGQVVKSITAAGNVSGSYARGPVTLLAFGAEGGTPASPGLMGIDLSPAGGGGSTLDVTEGIGTGFSSTTFTATSQESVQANVADLKFPVALANLDLAVTSGTKLVGEVASAGSAGNFPFQTSANTTYTVNVLAQPAAASNSQPEAAGTYAMSVAAAPVVTLGASSASVASGNPVTLTWTAQNATSCTAAASPSNSGWSGSESPTGSPATTAALTATTDFTLSCSGAGGTDSASVTVTVTAAAKSGGSGGGGSMDLGILAALAALLALRSRQLHHSRSKE